MLTAYIQAAMRQAHYEVLDDKTCGRPRWPRGAGSFGEYPFLRVQAEDERVEINDRYFQVRLLPDTQIKLKIEMRRYANQPTYALRSR